MFQTNQELCHGMGKTGCDQLAFRHGNHAVRRESLNQFRLIVARGRVGPALDPSAPEFQSYRVQRAV
jgi:hypothetical protein